MAEARAEQRQHFGEGVVFRRDQFEPRALAGLLAFKRQKNIGIGRGEPRSFDGLGHGIGLLKAKNDNARPALDAAQAIGFQFALHAPRWLPISYRQSRGGYVTAGNGRKICCRKTAVKWSLEPRPSRRRLRRLLRMRRKTEYNLTLRSDVLASRLEGRGQRLRLHMHFIGGRQMHDKG